MKRLAIITAVTFLLALSSVVWAMETVDPLIQQAMEQLEAKKGASRLCALTNAPYVSLNGKNCPEVVDVIQDVTGCSVGRVD